MAESFLDGHEIRSGFIQMKTESMSAAVEYEAPFSKAGALHSLVKDVTDRLRVNAGTRLLAGEKPVLTGSTGIGLVDVINQDKQGFF